ncbi:hypothetical protein BaRGS_00002314 [Batillaria attramentaria]|uniref:Uncharacterized protein n=1 Tax=Batillaria attramentaria TaxID=370345 RepID=A0ABD0M4N0_9CAEN
MLKPRFGSVNRDPNISAISIVFWQGEVAGLVSPLDLNRMRAVLRPFYTKTYRKREEGHGAAEVVMIRGIGGRGGGGRDRSSQITS